MEQKALIRIIWNRILFYLWPEKNNLKQLPEWQI